MRTAFTHKKFCLIFVLLLCCAAALNACGGADESTATITPSAMPSATPTALPEGYLEYFAQSGDTLVAVAAHFGVKVGDILSDPARKATLLLAPGERLLVKDTLLEETTSPELLFPDSAIVYSRAALDLDVQAFAESQAGFFSGYKELMTRGTVPASEIVEEITLGYSINPRILLVLIEYESGWVTNPRPDEEQIKYPLGWQRADRSGIYFQSGWAIRQLSQGYYGWRSGSLSELTFSDGSSLRLSPYLNAGTVAVMYALAQTHERAGWEAALYGERNVVDIHTEFFGDAFKLGKGIDPLLTADVEQPEMNLPFLPNRYWNLTGGPHAAWGSGWSEIGVLAALDFAPPLDQPGCGVSRYCASAAAAGLVVRDGGGVVVIDLDGDGYEQTGWVLVYMHIANTERAQAGDWLEVDECVGHPSCVGGSSSGIHVHIARKYNGEWVLADGGLPFVLSGYHAYNGEKKYEGTLSNGETTVVANIAGNYWTRIIRPDSEPKYLYTPTPHP